MRSTSGMTCCHFFCSHVFSMPVCRNPIVGSTETMFSPSSSSTSRSTPCVLGCCGPMLTVIVSVLISAIDCAQTVPAAYCLLSVRPLHPIALDVRPEFFLADFERLVGLRCLAN